MNRLDALFKTCDVAGRWGHELTESAVRWIVTAFGTWLRPAGLSRVMVAADLRAGGRPLRQAVLDGLRDARATAWDLGVAPVGMLRFAERTLQADATIHVTGGSRPADWNGLRFTRQGWPLLPDDLAHIRRLSDDEITVVPGGSREVISVGDEYRRWILESFAGRLGECHLVLDSGGGSWGESAARLLGQLGLVVTVVGDPSEAAVFDPTHPELLARLSAAVLAHRADAGLAFDSDGDRFALVDHRGHPIPASVVGALLTREALAEAVKYPQNLLPPGIVRDRPWSGKPITAADRSKHGGSGQSVRRKAPATTPVVHLPGKAPARALGRPVSPAKPSSGDGAPTGDLLVPASPKSDSREPRLSPGSLANSSGSHTAPDAREGQPAPSSKLWLVASDTPSSHPDSGLGLQAANPDDPSEGSTISEELLTQPTIVIDPRCGLAITEAIATGGGQAVYVRTGANFLHHGVLARQAALGLSGVGHVFRGDLCGGADGLWSALKVLAMFCGGPSPSRLADLVDSVAPSVASPELRVPCTPDEAQNICEALAVTFADDALEIHTQDGIRLDFPQAWALVRPAIDLPVLSIRFEGRTADDLADVAELVGEQLPPAIALAVRSALADPAAVSSDGRAGAAQTKK